MTPPLPPIPNPIPYIMDRHTMHRGDDSQCQEDTSVTFSSNLGKKNPNMKREKNIVKWPKNGEQNLKSEKISNNLKYLRRKKCCFLFQY